MSSSVISGLVTAYRKHGDSHILTAQCRTQGCGERANKNLEARGDVEGPCRYQCCKMRTIKVRNHVAQQSCLVLTRPLRFDAFCLGFRDRRFQSEAHRTWGELIRDRTVSEKTEKAIGKE